MHSKDKFNAERTNAGAKRVGIGSADLLGSLDLKELLAGTLEIFAVESPGDLGPALLSSNPEKMQRFEALVGGDLSIDWLQRIYQYYCAERRDKKQDYTPKSLARFMARLCGEADVMIDLCAGSGALTIQRWAENKETQFLLYEIDGKVIPFLIFNLALRNIVAEVHHADVLSGESFALYRVSRGDKYGRVEVAS